MRIRLTTWFGFAACLFQGLMAKTISNKTFLSPRPLTQDMVIRYASWHNQFYNQQRTKHGGSFQASAFYSHSTNRKDLGNYFGYCASCNQQCACRDFINVVRVADFDAVGDNTWASYIVHDTRGVRQQNLAGMIQFRPEHEVWGVQLDYHQSMHQLAEGLFWEISLPIAEVKNNLNPRCCDYLKPITLPDHPSNGKTLMDYFKGCVSDMAGDSPSQQKSLTSAKIGCARHCTSIADIIEKMGYYIINKKALLLSINAYCTVPTGNRPSGEFLFEPVCGNGGYWIFGIGPDIQVKLWRSDKFKGDFFSSFKLSYGLDDTEKRTIGLRNNTGCSACSIPYAQYYLVGQKGVRHLRPFANISTQDVKVKHGLEFEGLVDVALTFNRFHVDLGYDLYAREPEQLYLKKTWSDDTYAIADVDYATYPNVPAFLYDANGNIDLSHIDDHILGQHTIQCSNLDLDAAATPSQVTHKIYASLGYMASGKTHVAFNIGGSYECAARNSAPENYTLWTNVNFVF